VKATVAADFPMVSLKTQKQWEKWLAANHSKLNGVWLQFFKNV